MLISLTSADRGQSLALMDILKKSITHNKVTFFITELTKTSAPGKNCKEIILPAFEDKKLCVKYTLLHYLSRTKTLRGGRMRLFISFRKPHNTVTSATIARWIRIVLNRVGIHGYGAHSTRSASTSLVCQAGLAVPIILKAADWSKESIFTRFYRRAPDNSEFGRSVLQARK